ncbi:MAG: hypothetical protein K5622_02510 [Endomicrobiaceae bacterium]|nr:hypothetical protein [Endomicrobiaceae bacterium]
MKKILAVVLLSIAVLTAQQVQAAFNDTYWGVRALGMGGAFTAVSNDANAPLYNVAGTAFTAQNEVTLMGSRLFAGLEGVEIGANYAGFVHPINAKYGTVSFAWSSISTPGLRREDTFNVGYARLLNDILDLDSEVVELSAGLNLKYLIQEVKFGENDKDLNTYKGAMTGDIGVLAMFSNGIGVGYSSKYVVPADIGFMEKDEVKNINVVGLSYYNDELPYIKIPYFTIALDVIFRDSESSIRAGVESYVLDKKLAIRLGGREEAFNIGFGYEFAFANETKLVIDYALELPLEVEESYGSHFFALTFKF